MEREIDVAASELLKRAAESGVFLSHSEDRLHFKLAVERFPEALLLGVKPGDPLIYVGASLLAMATSLSGSF
jgi:hypothetical protein